MKNIPNLLIICIFSLFATLQSSVFAQDEEPPIVSALPGYVSSDAVVLFDGTDLSKWIYTNGKPADWIVANGEMTVRGGSIVTKENFGDMQIHLEFCTPVPATGEEQGRGNSGVYIHRNYEVQVLDSYENSTYPDGMCGSVYLQHIPLVNASRPPGIWQIYDIIFHTARFDENGNIIKRPTLTVLHNGVLIQDNVEITSPTGSAKGNEEKLTGPIELQDHRNPVRYRNIWVRPLSPR
ncbi:DUF1080 domain-containing protein [candidate division KSB1 bacterium]